MIIVRDIMSEARRVLGTCTDEAIFERLTEAQDLLANLGNWDPLVGLMDICTTECEIVLPLDVEVPLAINVGGRPADFRNKWFEFHLNGPGSDCCNVPSGFSWADRGDYPTYRDIVGPSQLRCYSDLDEGAGFNIRVFGFDQNDKWIMTADTNGVLVDGFDVPVLWGLATGSPSPQVVKRITRVSKPLSRGFINLVGTAISGSSGAVNLGYYLPNETDPQYRRIKINGSSGICTALTCAPACTTWVRMRYRRKTFKINSLNDPIFLHSVTALKLGLMALKKYENDLIADYKLYKDEAKAALNEKQSKISGPNVIRVQMQRQGFMSKTGENLI